LLQPPPRRAVNPNEASSSAGAAAGTNWRSTAGQNLRRQSGYSGDRQRGRRGPYHNNRHQQHSNREPLQRRPNSNNYGSRRPNTPPTPFSELLLDVQHEEANKVIIIAVNILFKKITLGRAQVVFLRSRLVRPNRTHLALSKKKRLEL
jgi:hypothetical protein